MSEEQDEQDRGRAPEPQAEPAPEPQAEPAPEPQAEPAPEPQAEPAPEPLAARGRRKLSRDDRQLSEEEKAAQAARRQERLKQVQSVPVRKQQGVRPKLQRPEAYTRSGNPSPAHVVENVRKRLQGL